WIPPTSRRGATHVTHAARAASTRGTADDPRRPLMIDDPGRIRFVPQPPSESTVLEQLTTTPDGHVCAKCPRCKTWRILEGRAATGDPLRGPMCAPEFRQPARTRRRLRNLFTE